MDIIERLNDSEMYVDAVDDAIREIKTLRARIAELEAASGLVRAAPDQANQATNSDSGSDNPPSR